MVEKNNQEKILKLQKKVERLQQQNKELQKERHNYKRMYEKQKETNEKLRKENEELRKENKELRERIEILEKHIEKQDLILEELRWMLFKSTWKNKKDNKNNDKIENKEKDKKERTKNSYRRNNPKKEEITDVKVYDVNECDKCWVGLTNKIKYVRYVEDIFVPSVNKNKLKKVVKEDIYKWYCPQCKKWTFGKEIPSQECTLWEWIRAFVVYALTVLRMWYSQLKEFFETMAEIKISDWEIVNILKKESIRLRWEYENIKKEIEKEGIAHYDETSWTVQNIKEKLYNWVKTDPECKKRIYKMWRNRWGWNMEELKWEEKEIWITDNYGVYKNTFKVHQLCWSHPIRKLRDLKDSRKLNKESIHICKVSYEWMQELHKEILELKEKNEIEEEKKKELYDKFDEITEEVENEPEKLRKIKDWLKRDKDKYFTCLEYSNVPTTNNAAERALRPLVIKRKISFWNKTMQWAQMMEVIYSVVYTLLAESKSNFFTRYLNC